MLRGVRGAAVQADSYRTDGQCNLQRVASCLRDLFVGNMGGREDNLKNAAIQFSGCRHRCNRWKKNTTESKKKKSEKNVPLVQ